MNSSPPTIPSLLNVPASSTNGWLKPRKQVFHSVQSSTYGVPHGTKISANNKMAKPFAQTTFNDNYSMYYTPTTKVLVSEPTTSTPPFFPVLCASPGSTGLNPGLPRIKLKPRMLSKTFQKESQLKWRY